MQGDLRAGKPSEAVRELKGFRERKYSQIEVRRIKGRYGEFEKLMEYIFRDFPIYFKSTIKSADTLISQNPNDHFICGQKKRNNYAGNPFPVDDNPFD